MLLLLAGCDRGPTPTPVPTADEAAVQAARAAPMAGPGWSGPWARQVYAGEPEDPGAVAFAAGLDTPVVPWDGRRPPPVQGTVQFVYATPVLSVDALVDRLSATPGPRGELVIVLGGDDPRWAEQAATKLPWTGAGILDPRLSAALYTDPAPLDARQLGRVAAWTAADQYGLHYVTGGGPYPPGLAGLLDVVPSTDLRAEDPRTRAAAARALASDALAGDDEVAVRLAVAAHTSSQATLARLAADRDPLVRARAADRLADVAVLTPLLDDPSSVVRVVAGHRLATLAPVGALGAEAALRHAAVAPDAYLRWKAAFGLGSTPDGTEVLVELLRDVDADVRREAAHSLGRRKDPAAIDALVVAGTDTNSFVRRWVMEALAAFPADPRARAALEVGAADSTALVAQAAARALGRPAPGWTPPGPPPDDAAVAALAGSPDATSRKDVSKFLAGRPGMLPTLEALARDTDAEVRKSAVEAMGWFDPPSPALFAALGDADPDVVVTALDALRRDRGGTVEALAPLTRAKDPEVRLRAWEALARLGPSSALEAGAADPDERVRAAVVGVYPDRLAPEEPSVLVRRAAAAKGADAGADALVRAARPDADPAWGFWGRGVVAGEDDLVHERFSWNDAADKPAAYRALRPPVVREYGHPDRG